MHQGSQQEEASQHIDTQLPRHYDSHMPLKHPERLGWQEVNL